MTGRTDGSSLKAFQSAPLLVFIPLKVFSALSVADKVLYRYPMGILRTASKTTITAAELTWGVVQF